MDKHQWHKVFSEKSASHPASRWGHSCVAIGEEVVFFGGYADSNYMNDLWCFNSVSMSWTEIKTTGQIPSNRSNCSMNYDRANNRIILFGGGGANKKRFNSINILNWNTKEWTEINPNPTEPGPWERTYHSAELLFPYLIVFGGEGVADLDDLWVFSFETLKWIQVPIEKGEKIRPCARRFHSSVLIDKEFFVIAGCHSKYRCLSDIYSIDLRKLITTGSVAELKWKEVKVKSYSFLTRWGHSSGVYDNKIYIFGGRFSNDLNDILVIDLQKSTMKALKVTSDLPKARRRHSAVFVGSCMLIFGGFNGEYFSDLHYINVFELRSKLEVPQSCKESARLKLVNDPFLSDYFLTSSEGEKLFLHKGLIFDKFTSQASMKEFLQSLEGKYTSLQLLQILETLYIGIGRLPAPLHKNYSVELYDSVNQRENAVRKSILPSSVETGSIVGKTKINSSPIITLEDNIYELFLEEHRAANYNDATILVNNEYILPVNSAKLAVACRYFSSAFKGNKKQIVAMLPPNTNIVIYEVLLNYLFLDYVVVPVQTCLTFWTMLYTLGEYYCLGRLMSICENALVLRTTQKNCEQLLLFALQNNVEVLLLHCAQMQIKNIIFKEDDAVEIPVADEELAKRKEDVLNVVYNMLRFDIDQTQIEKENQLSQKNSHENEKENNQNVFSVD